MASQITATGPATALGEQDIPFELLKDSKLAVISLAKAVTETANPQLRNLMVNQLITTITQHHQLLDLALSRTSQPFLPPQQQIAKDLQMRTNLNL